MLEIIHCLNQRQCSMTTSTNSETIKRAGIKPNDTILCLCLFVCCRSVRHYLCVFFSFFLTFLVLLAYIIYVSPVCLTLNWCLLVVLFCDDISIVYSQ